MVRCVRNPILLGLVGLVLLIFGCQSRPELDFRTFESPDGAHQLKVTYKEPFGYGTHDLVFYGDGKILTTRELRNDGANLGDHNIQVHWMENSKVRVTLSGGEQKDDTFILVLSF